MLFCPPCGILSLSPVSGSGLKHFQERCYTSPLVFFAPRGTCF
nr:MAG TPA: hypothetical protein [Caudoviricetes sp.]